MTPRSFARTPSVTAEDVSEPAASEYDSGDESLPPHTSEIGTLKKLPNHGTAWLGSSSGVYFVNTVRRAFSAALVDANTSTIPASEDILTGEDADGHNYNGPVTDGPSVTEGDFRRVVLASLGRPPTDRSLAMELVTSFFQCWHPLFPFMHGPRFLQDIDAIYSMPNITATGTLSPAESRRVAAFQLIINIACLDRRDLHLPVESRIRSTSDVTRVAGCFSVNHDIAAIQVLLAAELYLVATISLRQASTVAGMILKLIYHAGLHRCPLRYAQLSLEDCEIRKRIFWSAYALDRHLSLSLGDPNTVQDNDIDVCLSGRELHKAVAHELIINPNDELKMHLPRPQTGPHGSGSPSDDPRVVNLNEGPQAREKAQREAAMTAYVHYGKLTGRIIEIFHKSIHARFQKPEAITFLNSDIETWWNDLPSTLTSDGDEEEDYHPPPVTTAQHNSPGNGNSINRNAIHSSSQPANTEPVSKPSTKSVAPTHKQLAPFFLILYHQLQLLLNRPRLSLDQSTAEFQHGLQVCIKASRNTLTALKKHRENGQSMLLPGLLSASWMAGLIIAFACQLGKYPKLRACSDISSCLKILESMGSRDWFTVKNCRKVLNLLLANIKGRKASTNGFLSVNSVQQQQQQQPPTGAMATVLVSTAGKGAELPRKRTWDEIPTAAGGSLPVDVTSTSSRKRKSVGAGEISPSSASASGSRMHPPTSSSRQQQQGVTRRNISPNVYSSTNTNNDASKNSNEWQNLSSANAPSTMENNTQHRRGLSNSSDRSKNGIYASSAAMDNVPYSNTTAEPGANQSRSSNPTISGAAVYADPSDLSYAQSVHNLNLNSTAGNTNTDLPSNGMSTNDNITFPPESLNIDDPLFWGNFDYNISDIFGAASWETMTGGVNGNDGLGGMGGMGGIFGGAGMGWGDLFGNSNDNSSNNNGSSNGGIGNGFG